MPLVTEMEKVSLECWKIFGSEGTVTTVQVVETSVTVNNSRKLKQRRRGQQRGRQKTIGLDWQNNNFTRALRFFVHFFAVTERLRRENA